MNLNIITLQKATKLCFIIEVNTLEYFRILYNTLEYFRIL